MSLRALRHVPYEGLTLAIGKEVGDYRRVGQECWDQLMRLYGGGPAIYVDGPPVEDLSRYCTTNDNSGALADMCFQGSVCLVLFNSVELELDLV